MKKPFLYTILLFVLFNCGSDSQKKKSESSAELDQTEIIDTIIKYRADGTKDSQVQTKNGLKTGNKLLFDQNENIVGLNYYENDTLNGYGFLLNENTLRPKYLFENNNGKRDGVLISFYENGFIKKFRTADIFNDSQVISFHENGTIKEIGQTKKGRAHGTSLYFNEKGLLEKTVEYVNGNVKN